MNPDVIGVLSRGGVSALGRSASGGEGPPFLLIVPSCSEALSVQISGGIAGPSLSKGLGRLYNSCQG